MTIRLAAALGLLGAVGTIVAVTSAAAQKRVPEPVDAAEAAVLPDVAAAMTMEKPDLSSLDRLLVRLPRPTPVRGMVQSIRAAVLLDADRNVEAKAAAEEAVRLTPGFAMSRIIAAYVLTFVGAPTAAAGYWLEASRLDPEIARQTEEYQLTALIGRLREAGRKDMADLVAARMAEIGVRTALAPARSAAAAARLRTVSGTAAETAINDVLAPDHMMSFYIDRDFAYLWPSIERWSGADLADLDRRYMEELRSEWWSQRSMNAAVNYGRALNARRAYAAVATLFAPLLGADQLTRYEDGIEFLAPVVARALYATGKGADAQQMIDRVEALMPKGAEALALNVSAVRINRAYETGTWSAVERLTGPWLAQVEKMGPQVNASAGLMVAAYRVCALEKLGHAGEAALLAASIEMAGMRLPAPAMKLENCRGDFAKMRKLALAGLSDKERVSYYLALLQPHAPDPGATPSTQAEDALVTRLSTDPDVAAAMAKVGRRLPKPVGETLPRGFDPLLQAPAPPLRPDSA